MPVTVWSLKVAECLRVRHSGWLSSSWRRTSELLLFFFLLSWSLHAQHNHHIRSCYESFQNTSSEYVSICPWHWRVPGTVELVDFLLISLSNEIMGLWNDLTCDAHVASSSCQTLLCSSTWHSVAALPGLLEMRHSGGWCHVKNAFRHDHLWDLTSRTLVG